MSLRVRERTLDELVPFPGNPRVHPAEQLEALAASIRRFGFVVPVVVDGSGTILAGHARVEAARLAGLSRVPTVEAADLTEGQRAAFVASDNKVALMAGWDPALLDALLRDLTREGFDVAAVGFSDLELGRLADDVDAAALRAVVPAPPAVAGVEEAEEPGPATDEAIATANGQPTRMLVLDLLLPWDARERVFAAIDGARGAGRERRTHEQRSYRACHRHRRLRRDVVRLPARARILRGQPAEDHRLVSAVVVDSG